MKNWNRKLHIALWGSMLLMLRVFLVTFIPFLFFILGYTVIGIAVIGFLYILNFLTLIPVFLNPRSSSQTKISWAVTSVLLPGGEFLLWYNGTYISRKQKNKIKASQLLESEILSKENLNKSKVTKYENGFEKFPELIKELESAKVFINLMYFIISDGIVWKKIEDILIRKHNEGVKVRVFTDFIGNLATSDKVYKRLKDKGIEFVSFNKMSWFWPMGFMNCRSHNKSVIIDNRVAFFGGLNIGDEYASLSPKYGMWFDTHYKLEGEIVDALNDSFIVQWNIATGKDISKEFENIKPVPVNNSYEEIEFINEDPMKPEPLFLTKMIELIRSSNKSIRMITPYLIIPYELIREIKTAVDRGVEIEIITIGLADKASAYYIGQYQVEQLNEIGVKVYRTQDTFIHSKMYIFDQEKVIFGTTNLDFRALYLHYETDIYIKDKDFARKLNEQFIKNRANSFLTTNSRIEWGFVRTMAYKFFRFTKGLF